MTPGPELLAQHFALTQNVGFAELPGRTILAVTGGERSQFLQSFTTNDIKKLAAGAGCECFVTSSQGKTLGHVLIFCGANHDTIDTAPAQADTLISHFERYVITEDVQFTDRTAELGDLLVAGPQATDLLANLAGVSPPTQLLAHVPAAIAARAVVLRRVEYAGRTSYFVQAAASDRTAIAAALRETGAVPCGGAAVEAARIEAGVPLFGLDITAENLPQEVARDERAISFTKGCYLGQETVARIDAMGHVNRLLLGLQFTGQDVPPSGTPLAAGEQTIGQVTTSAWSPRITAPLALAYVRRSQAKKGSILSSPFGRAEVIELPLATA